MARITRTKTRLVVGRPGLDPGTLGPNRHDVTASKQPARVR